MNFVLSKFKIIAAIAATLLLVVSCNPVKNGEFTIKGERIYKQDKSAPKLLTYSPLHQETDVRIDANLVAEFDDEIKVNQSFLNQVAVTISKMDDSSKIEIDGSDLSVVGKTLMINPSVDLEQNTEYYVIIEPLSLMNYRNLTFDGIDKTSGISGLPSWSFTTESLASVSATPLDLTTNEDGDVTDLVLVLGSPPSSNVSIALTSSDTSEGTVSSSNITFTPGNWNIAQTVSVSGIDDDINDGDQSFDIDFLVTSTDLNYNNYNLSSVTLTNLENDDVPPSILLLNPLTASNSSPTAGTISLTFNENVQVGHGNIYIKKYSDDSIAQTINAATMLNTTGAVASFNYSGLSILTQYYIEVCDTCISDGAPARLNYFEGISSKLDWTFSTTDDISPSISSVSPTDNSNAVSITSDLVITFNENIEKGTGNIVIKRVSNSSTFQTIDVTSLAVNIVSGNNVNISLNTLEADTEYYVEIASTCFKDTSANENEFAGMTGSSAWNFSTLLYEKLEDNYLELGSYQIEDVSDDRTRGVYVKAGTVYLWDFLTNTSTLVSKAPGTEIAVSGINPRISGNGEFIVYESDYPIVSMDTNNLRDVYLYEIDSLASNKNTKITNAELRSSTAGLGDGMTCTQNVTYDFYCQSTSYEAGLQKGYYTSNWGALYLDYHDCIESIQGNQVSGYDTTGFVSPYYTYIYAETQYSYNEPVLYLNADINEDGSLIVYEKVTYDHEYQSSNSVSCSSVTWSQNYNHSSIMIYNRLTQIEQSAFNGYYSSNGFYTDMYCGSSYFSGYSTVSYEKPALSPDGTKIAYYLHNKSESYYGDSNTWSCQSSSSDTIYPSANGVNLGSPFSVSNSVSNYNWSRSQYDNQSSGSINGLSSIALDNNKVIFGVNSYSSETNYGLNYINFYCDTSTARQYSYNWSSSDPVDGGTLLTPYSTCSTVTNTGYTYGNEVTIHQYPDSGFNYYVVCDANSTGNFSYSSSYLTNTVYNNADYNTCVYSTNHPGGSYQLMSSNVSQDYATVTTNNYTIALASFKWNGTSYTSQGQHNFGQGFNLPTEIALHPTRDEIAFLSTSNYSALSDYNSFVDIYHSKLNFSDMSILSLSTDGTTQGNANSGISFFFTEDGTGVDFSSSASNLGPTNSAPPMWVRKYINPL